jgi:hypothetical protein
MNELERLKKRQSELSPWNPLSDAHLLLLHLVIQTDINEALATAYREQGEKLEKAIFYLESISGGWDPDWMLKRAYEGLAEIGIKGYETNGQELRETAKAE